MLDHPTKSWGRGFRLYHPTPEWQKYPPVESESYPDHPHLEFLRDFSNGIALRYSSPKGQPVVLQNDNTVGKKTNAMFG